MSAKQNQKKEEVITPKDPATVPAKNKVERAVFLLQQAQQGINVIIGGSGPYEDVVSGIFFQGLGINQSEMFYLSQWNKLVDELINEVTNAKN